VTGIPEEWLLSTEPGLQAGSSPLSRCAETAAAIPASSFPTQVHDLKWRLDFIAMRA